MLLCWFVDQNFMGVFNKFVLREQSNISVYGLIVPLISPTILIVVSRWELPAPYLFPNYLPFKIPFIPRIWCARTMASTRQPTVSGGESQVGIVPNTNRIPSFASYDDWTIGVLQHGLALCLLQLHAITSKFIILRLC